VKAQRALRHRLPRTAGARGRRASRAAGVSSRALSPAHACGMSRQAVLPLSEGQQAGDNLAPFCGQALQRSRI
jgi:hypothetical protein